MKKQAIEVLSLNDLPDLSNFYVSLDTEIKFKLKLDNTKLIYPINIIHEQPNYNTEIQIKIALLNNSYLEIPVNITIKKGAIKSSTNFNAIIFILDQKSKVKITPALHIYEKEINGASHGLIVKNIKRKDTYYLESRGIDFDTAKNLIIGF